MTQPNLMWTRNCWEKFRDNAIAFCSQVTAVACVLPWNDCTFPTNEKTLLIENTIEIHIWKVSYWRRYTWRPIRNSRLNDFMYLWGLQTTRLIRGGTRLIKQISSFESYSKISFNTYKWQIRLLCNVLNTLYLYNVWFIEYLWSYYKKKPIIHL